MCVPGSLVTMTLEVTHPQSRARMRVLLDNGTVCFLFQLVDLAFRKQINGFRQTEEPTYKGEIASSFPQIQPR